MSAGRYGSKSLCAVCAKSLQSCLTVRPHGLQSTRLLCPWESPGKNTGVGCHALLQGIFPTQGLNPHLLPLICIEVVYSKLAFKGFQEYFLTAFEFLPTLKTNSCKTQPLILVCCDLQSIFCIFKANPSKLDDIFP